MFLSLYFINNEKLKSIHVEDINHIAKSAEEQWNNKTMELPKVNLRYKVIDLKGNIKFSNYKAHYVDYDEDIINSLKAGDVIADIIINNTITGKLIIKNDINYLSNMKRNLSILVIVVFSSIILLIIIFSIYFNKVLYKPFKKLEKFASRVSEGNLDIPLEMDKENVFGAFTESFDIMREQLKISRQNEYLANMSKKELIASLSHDIKTPVASIKAICEIMEIKYKNKDEAEKIHTIYKKSNQIEKLINDMFQSTLEELQELKVNSCIYESSLIYDLILNNNFYDKISISNSLPKCLIYADKLRLEQVVDNIINNSYKYADTEIEISFSLSETHLEVSFKDFGKGVKEEELPLIFNKFYRGKNTKEVKGSGLGLYLSKYFMEHMEGGINCYNEDHGFVVKIYIKLAY